MKTLIIYLICTIIFPPGLFAQDSMLYRIILIGDAGKISKQQQAVIANASQQVLQNRTMVLYLGDNIYPRGLNLPGSGLEEKTGDILQSQFKPMRAKGASVYFIPGNHDWDKSGRNGLQKIRQEGKYLERQHDTLLRLIPANGCPDPVPIRVSPTLTIIAFDSEWWLFPFTKTSKESSCRCTTEVAVSAQLRHLVLQNKDHMILLASHHPLQSYGTHAGYYSWKNHLFPFTTTRENLYIPLPVIGSIYLFIKKKFSKRQDLSHALYRNMINEIKRACEGHSNIIHVAGHEHGLQFIESETIQIVSGSGAKHSYVKKGKHSLFAQSKGGFVIADVYTDTTIHFSYYKISGTGCNKVFDHIKTFKRQN